jgi:hypothetical protein
LRRLNLTTCVLDWRPPRRGHRQLTAAIGRDPRQIIPQLLGRLMDVAAAPARSPAATKCLRFSHYHYLYENIYIVVYIEVQLNLCLVTFRHKIEVSWRCGQ